MGLEGRGRRLQMMAWVCVYAFLLALPSLVNGKPFLFYDSAHYYDIGETIVSALLESSQVAAPLSASGPAAPILPGAGADGAASVA